MLHTETLENTQENIRETRVKETRAGRLLREAGIGGVRESRATKLLRGATNIGASNETIAPARRRVPRVNIADELVASLDEAADIMAGRVAPSRFYPARAKVDVRAIRQQFGLSQPDFAKRFGFSLATLREWEQGRRQPEAAARVLLLVIAAHPGAVEDVLARDVPVAA